MQQACNVGYPRGCCDCFPSDAEIDAVRFHVTEDTPDRIRIQYTLEKDCWPCGDGILEYFVSDRRLEAGAENEILRSQAGAFLTSYLRRRD